MIAPDPKAVEIARLKYSWPTGSYVLDLTEFNLEVGERVLIVGPSGSGKSTLLNLICGTIKPSSGTLNVLGQSLVTMGEAQRDQFRAAHLGVIFQTLNVLPYLSALDNVALACRFSKFRADMAAKGHGNVNDAACHILERLFIDGELLHRPARFLSVGQQQRVAVARALVGMPQLIVADEPSSALDADTREEFMRLIMEESEKSRTSMIFASHDPMLANYFDRVVDLTSLNQVEDVSGRLEKLT